MPFAMCRKLCVPLARSNSRFFLGSLSSPPPSSLPYLFSSVHSDLAAAASAAAALFLRGRPRIGKCVLRVCVCVCALSARALSVFCIIPCVSDTRVRLCSAAGREERAFPPHGCYCILCCQRFAQRARPAVG